MTDFVVVLAPAAERDIAEAFKWYRARNALAADGFRAEVFDAVDRISEGPMRRRADAHGDRRSVLKHFPYSVVYEVIDATVTVIAVAHHRRRPNYWRVNKP